MSSLPPKEGGFPAQDKTDRRAHPRRAVSPRLYVALYGANSDGILYDVSEGGAALDILGSQPEGEFIVVDFEMAEIGRQFEAKARITWRDEAGKKVGLHFVDLPEASRVQLKEWLIKKVLAEDGAPPGLVLEAARDVVAAPMAKPADLREPDGVKPLATSGERQADERSGEHLVQNLIESFNKRQSASPEKSWSGQFSNIFAPGQTGFAAWDSRRWVALTVAACLGIIVVLGIVAHRSPAGNAGINVSKVGQLPDTGPVNDGEAPSAVRADSSAGQPNGVDVPAPGVPPPLLPSISKNPAGQPCINLGSRSEKIRIYLWSEKDTPAQITAAYVAHLKAVLDVRIVNQAPYDLVLYVNGAGAGASGLESGFIWSSRVFRPWYCGQSLGLLEQTRVNESLHYVEVGNLDRYIQSEVAYLILHTFETIRKEHTRLP